MKIRIVGAEQVGATAAYAMMMRGVGSEIVLVDRKTDLAVAQAHDILDATPGAYPVRVRAGEAADLEGAGIVVLAAGAAQKPASFGRPLTQRSSWGEVQTHRPEAGSEQSESRRVAPMSAECKTRLGAVLE